MEHQFERVVVPVAGTSADGRVLSLLPRLVEPGRAVLTLLFVVAVPQSMRLDAELPEAVIEGERALGRAEAAVRAAFPAKRAEVLTELLQARSVGAAIVDEAIERDADAVVLAASIRHRHGRPTLGETVNYVLLNAPCDVLVLRLAPDDREAPEAVWR